MGFFSDLFSTGRGEPAGGQTTTTLAAQPPAIDVTATAVVTRPDGTQVLARPISAADLNAAVDRAVDDALAKKDAEDALAPTQPADPLAGTPAPVLGALAALMNGGQQHAVQVLRDGEVVNEYYPNRAAADVAAQLRSQSVWDGVAAALQTGGQIDPGALGALEQAALCSPQLRDALGMKSDELVTQLCFYDPVDGTGYANASDVPDAIAHRIVTRQGVFRKVKTEKTGKKGKKGKKTELVFDHVL